MPHSQSILERLRWKVGLGLVIVAAAAAHPSPAGHDATNVARSSWSDTEQQARSSWGAEMELARSSWSISELTADAA